jgi:hypothetical protein
MTEKDTEQNSSIAQQYLLISMHMYQSLTDEDRKSVMVNIIIQLMFINWSHLVMQNTVSNNQRVHIILKFMWFLHPHII